MSDLYGEFLDALHEVQRASGLGAIRLGRLLSPLEGPAHSGATGNSSPEMDAALIASAAAGRVLLLLSWIARNYPVEAEWLFRDSVGGSPLQERWYSWQKALAGVTSMVRVCLEVKRRPL